MTHYRVTIRFGSARQQYHVMDISADSLRDAVRLAAEDFPESALADADLIEIRRQTQPNERG
jgi:hypothetical protein